MRRENAFGSSGGMPIECDIFDDSQMPAETEISPTQTTEEDGESKMPAESEISPTQTTEEDGESTNNDNNE